MIGQSPQEAPHENVTDADTGASAGAEHTPATTESAAKQTPREWGGREGPEPTRYGDWEKNGRCIDF
ncbi:MAG TPA: DUF1674 domain-containing protein [Lysobacter sp.]|jgi:hypothetical protein|nr:DUF1674 domain-containing protein [Lysobacter sp.]